MKGPTYLIADDNAGVRRVLSILLGATGATTLTAEDGDAALEAARRCLPDLILLDVNMPGRDGHQVAAALRAEEATRRIPILMLSGLGEVDENRGLDSGADDFLGKPFRFDNLMARVRALLRRSAQEARHS
jgi:DNA-binding response OmpR family regulator